MAKKYSAPLNRVVSGKKTIGGGGRDVHEASHEPVGRQRRNRQRSASSTMKKDLLLLIPW